MARKPLIGHLPECPTCGMDSMEVRLDKNDHPYAFCEDCNTQILTHGKRKGKLMLDRMTPVVHYEVDDGKVVILPDPEPVSDDLEEAIDEAAQDPAPVKSESVKKPATLMG